MKNRLAVTIDGSLSFCTASEDNIGKGSCKHIAHQSNDESTEAFTTRVESEIRIEDENSHVTNEVNILPVVSTHEDFEDNGDISQEEINEIAFRLDEIAGEKLTVENFEEVISKLPPEKIAEISNIAFDSAPKFSLPIDSEKYEEEEMKNNLYFATLPNNGIAGKVDSVDQMFKRVGAVTIHGGEQVEIEGSYKAGLSEEEYDAKQYETRDTMIKKSIETAIPGYTARLLFYGLSDIRVIEDCGGSHTGAISCDAPEGGICKKCASQTPGGEFLNPAEKIGGKISTNLSEPLTQLSMKKKEMTGAKGKAQGDHAGIIMDTLKGFGTSPIIQEAAKQKTTEEMREVMFRGLKDAYTDAGIKEDDFNIVMVARKLTSYTRDRSAGGVLRPVQPGEKASIVSLGALGNRNNIFKASQLSTGYRNLTRPQKQTISSDAANEIMM